MATARLKSPDISTCTTRPSADWSRTPYSKSKDLTPKHQTTNMNPFDHSESRKVTVAKTTLQSIFIMPISRCTMQSTSAPSLLAREGNRWSTTDHLMTRSARTSTFCGIVNPICFAVLRLITISYFVGCSTGRSAGFAPLRILSTYLAARCRASMSLVE